MGNGNICRSPIAEAVLIEKLKAKGEHEWKIDSAAIIDYHIGKPPDSRAMKVLKENGITDYKHKCRQLRREDFKDFQYIVGMDDDNIRDIEEVQPRNSTAKVLLLGDYDPENVRIIQDPYYGEYEGFPVAFKHVSRCIPGFIDFVQKS